MHEPYGWKDICGPGAMRVVLAFTADPIKTIKADGDSVAKGVASYGYRATGETWAKRHVWTSSTTGNHPDGQGTDFMMYVASQLVALYHGNSASHAEKLTDDDGHVRLGIDLLLDGLSGSKGKDWFKYRNTRDGHDNLQESQTSAEGWIKASIQGGVPAIVGAKMYLLPSQANSQSTTANHWVSILAYDQNYFYYVDTCWQGEACGFAGSALFDPYDAKTGQAQQFADTDLKDTQVKVKGKWTWRGNNHLGTPFERMSRSSWNLVW